MWASNLLAVYWVLLYATTFTETAVGGGVVGRWSAAVVGCGLAAVRQRDLLKRNADEDDAASGRASARVSARDFRRPKTSMHLSAGGGTSTRLRFDAVGAQIVSFAGRKWLQRR